MTDPCCGSEKKMWFRSGSFILTVIALLLLTASAYWKPLEGYGTAFWDYLKLVFWPVLLGFFFGGAIDYFIPHSYVSKHLALHKKRTILYSVGLGFLLSACSHGILAISMEIHKKGASAPAIVALLLASPWANLPVTFLLFGFFGFKAFLILGSAILIALLTGWTLQFLLSKGLVEDNPHSVEVEEGFSICTDIKNRFKEKKWSFGEIVKDIRGVLKGMAGLFEMVYFWMALGLVLAAAASAFVPPHIFHDFFGPDLLGLFVTLAAATVIEVCSEGTAPMAFEIYKQTSAFGNVLVFLMAGVATDVTEIGLLWKNVGRKTALWMVILTLPQIVLLGYVFNILF